MVATDADDLPEAELREAIAQRAFTCAFQPIVCLNTGAITGFEALARWTHPERGPISPAAFIPLAERAGLIVPLGAMILDMACAEAASWRQPLKISVNLSPVQIDSPDIVETVRETIRRTGLDARRLDLEVTEGVMIRDPAKTIATLRALQALGINISMDDFGTGYCSLGYFRSFPFNKVKIDRSFVSGLAQSREAFAIVKAIIALGKGLGMTIIAEGVEHQEEATLLHQEGCDKIQGFLISKPQPIEHFERIVREGRGGHPCSERCDECIERLRASTPVSVYALP